MPRALSHIVAAATPDGSGTDRGGGNVDGVKEIKGVKKGEKGFGGALCGEKTDA